MDDLYQYCLVLPISVNITTLYLLYRQNPTTSWDFSALTDNTTVCRVRHSYMLIYILLIAADWLQGSFFYAVYRENHGLSESTIGNLSAAGFATGALTVTFVGSLADNYGRKKGCLFYCFISAFSCLTVLMDDIRILFARRVLGGLATTLLYSVFEPWLLSELDCLCISPGERESLASQIFALMSVSNGLIAIASGIFSEYLVRITSSMKSPFFACVFLMIFAARFIGKDWSENYGENRVNQRQSHTHFLVDLKRLREIWDLRTQRLSIITFTFESTVYVIVYFWPSAITSTRPETSPPPFGLIFPNFMSSMMLSSTIFRLLSPRYPWIAGPRHAAQYLPLIAAFSLAITALTTSEGICFASLCLFEVCLGAYTPMIASMKDHSLPQKHRSRIYGLLRVPTNVFVVLALLSFGTGNINRSTILMFSSALLTLGSAVTTLGFADEDHEAEILLT